MIKVGVLTSGRGNAVRLIAAAAEQSGAAQVTAVAANRDCPALAVAAGLGIASIGTFERAGYASALARDAAMAAFLAAAGTNLVVSGGYTEAPLEPLFTAFPDRVISMYPALLPAYAEEDEAIGPALRYGVKVIGVTFHLRSPGTMSGGPIISQHPIPVTIDDTVASVEPRIAYTERRYLPGIIAAFAAGRIVREGARIRVLDGANA